MTHIDAAQRPPRITALGGSTRPNSNTEQLLRYAADLCKNRGAEVRIVAGRELILPIYDTETTERSPEAQRLLEDIRWADGLIVASPGYHGGVSGLVKNALDYVEDTRTEARTYLHDMPVGIIACAHGWQAGVTTLEQLRTVVHALRGWPTPLGAVINPSEGLFDESGRLVQRHAEKQLDTLVSQVLTAVTRRIDAPID